MAPLITALKAGHFQTAKFLRDNGAHPNVTGYEERSPLHAAAWYGDFKMVQVLLEYKADVNARSAHHETPLHCASQGWKGYSSGHTLYPLLPKVARLLLEHGADVNALMNGRIAALYMATRLGNVEVVRVLLEHGVDVGAETEDGETAFQRKEESTEIMKLLSETRC
jgi:ankyrin repeat protein